MLIAGGAGQIADGDLVGGVEVGVHQGHGHGFEAVGLGPRQALGHRLAVQGRDHAALGVEPFDGLDHAAMQGRGLDDIEGEQVRPGLVADVQDVAEALGRDEQGSGALAFEQGVGSHGRAHLDRGHALGGEGRAGLRAQQAAHGLDGGVGIKAGGRGEFERMQGAACRPTDHIGEGAAAIDPELPFATAAVANFSCHLHARILDLAYSDDFLAQHRKSGRPTR